MRRESAKICRWGDFLFLDEVLRRVQESSRDARSPFIMRLQTMIHHLNTHLSNVPRFAVHQVVELPEGCVQCGSLALAPGYHCLSVAIMTARLLSTDILDRVRVAAAAAEFTFEDTPPVHEGEINFGAIALA